MNKYQRYLYTLSRDSYPVFLQGLELEGKQRIQHALTGRIGMEGSMKVEKRKGQIIIAKAEARAMVTTE